MVFQFHCFTQIELFYAFTSLEAELLIVRMLEKCYNFSKEESDLTNLISAASHSIAAIASLISIFLIAISRAYKEFLHRLFLYLSITVQVLTVCVTVTTLFELLHYDAGKLSVMLAVVSVYCCNLYPLFLSWMGLYFFLLAALRVQLNKKKHEITGLVITLLLPMTVSWIVLSKGQYMRHFKCFNVKSQELLLYTIYLPLFISILFTTVAIGGMLLVLCKNLQNNLQQQHMKVVKRTIPLLLFLASYQIVSSTEVSFALYQIIAGKSAPASFIELFYFHPLVFMNLPLVLLCQPSVRQKLYCCKQCKLKLSRQASNYQTFNHSTAAYQPDYTYYSIPSDSSISKDVLNNHQTLTLQD